MCPDNHLDAEVEVGQHVQAGGQQDQLPGDDGQLSLLGPPGVSHHADNIAAPQLPRIVGVLGLGLVGAGRCHNLKGGNVVVISIQIRIRPCGSGSTPRHTKTSTAGDDCCMLEKKKLIFVRQFSPELPIWIQSQETI